MATQIIGETNTLRLTINTTTLPMISPSGARSMHSIEGVVTHPCAIRPTETGRESCPLGKNALINAHYREQYGKTMNNYQGPKGWFRDTPNHL